MKKPTTLKSVLVVLLFIQSFIAFSQKDFSVRYDTSLKGDMLLIGNNILNRDANKTGERPNNAFDATDKNNNDLNMQYIDVDGDNGTFSSSTANLAIPTASAECYKIVYAGLYWTGILSKASIDDGTTIRANIGNVKFKLPGETAYRPIVGEKVYDYYPDTANGDQIIYAYYYNVTTLLQGLTNPQGTYTVADVISARGTINGGFAAGWSLFVIYEDPKATAKYITSFDGFRFIKANSPDVTYDISGFKTIPTGDVNAKLAFAANEGDRNTTGDRYSINGTDIFTNERPVDNFFNSTINNIDGPFTDRNPKSVNTLGYDSGIIKLNNANNSVIKNGDTKATLKLRTSGDGYGLFFNAFNVEIIEPKIVLTKIVQDAQGNNIGGQNVTLGQLLNYKIGFRNSGNDDATSFTIRDQLPINVIFNYPADLLPLPTGVSVKSWNPATRSIVFEVDNSLVKKGGITETTIGFKVQVIPDCTMLDEACSNSIDNSAYATYKGTQNTTFVISDDPSVNTNTGCLLIPKATNFLVNVAGCEYKRTATLCTDSVNLVAADGYSTYTWYSDAAMKNQIGTGQTFAVKNPGVYYVYNLAPAPCRSISESFTVTRFGATADNPVLAFADQIVTCPNDGKKLPNIFLCGANAFKDIKTGISDSNNIVWERLNTASCAATTNENCANEGTACQWLPAGTGPDYKASIAGQYRLTINYAGSCFSRFYFNVYTNSLDPTAKVVDILCGKAGSITIEGVPAGYEYAIRTDPNGAYGAWQNSNVFPIAANAANSYSVNIRQKGVTTNPCIFNVPNILVRSLDLVVNTEITQPVCYGETGSIKIGAQNLDQYYYYLYNSSNTLLQTVGPVSTPNQTFASLTPGVTYYVRITSSALTGSPTPPAPSCNVKTANIKINTVTSQTKVVASISEPLTACNPGKILLTGSGGTAPYTYFVNGSPTYINTNPFEYTAGGTYNIEMVDSKGCKATTSITVTDAPKPTYDIKSTNSTCYGGTSSISIENVVANGYTMGYSINDGGSYSTNPLFSNLSPGDYKVKVRYSITTNGVKKECFDASQSIKITGPTAALTASAGVGALAGCTLPDANGVNQGGLLRITNVQGGTPGYEYSFNGGTSWQTTNEKDVLPGSYILKVRDKLGCEYTIPYNITLDQKPADPTIIVEDPVFSCNGTATSKVTVTNGTSANYTYEYYLDTKPNTPITNNTFTNVPSGTHIVSVKYNVTTATTFSNLLKEDFGSGQNTTTPGIAAAYCFHDLSVVPSTCSDTRLTLEDNQYEVTSAIIPNNGSWYPFRDHTSLGANPNGRFLAVNIGSVAGPYGVLYSKPIVDVIPNQPVKVDLFVANLLNVGVSGAAPIVRFQLVDPSGNVVAQADTGKIAEATTDPNRAKWVAIPTFSLDPGNNTNLTFVVRSGSLEYNGNDLLIDDISVYQVPRSCIAQKDFKVIIDSNKAFQVDEPIIDDVSCNGVTPPDGKITLTVKNFTGSYQYSINNGSTWSTATVSPFTISGLGVGTYNIIVKSDTAGTCSTSFTKTISAPTALTISASVVTQPTCTTGASIKAIAGGGVPNYKYELRLTNGTIVVPFQDSDTFNLALNQTGNFVVFIKDAGPCSSGASNTVNITPAVPPTATLDLTASDLCYDLANKATLVVSVSNGLAPFSYSLDGQAGQSGNSFVVGTGLHTIVVTDANGCTANVTGIPTIANELTASADVTKKLDCTASPNAQITITPQNGTPGYTYEVSVNGGGYTAIGSNIYPTSVAGSFVFRVTDSKGCKFVTLAVKVDAKVDPTASITSQNDPKCNNGTDGQFTVLAEGGNGAPYTYSFNGGAFGTSATYSGLNAFVGGVNTRTYTYQVKDSKGCISPTYNVTLTNPTKVVASAIFTPNTTCSATTLITTSGQYGSGGYTYNFGAGNTSYNNTNTLLVTNKNVAQTITYSVKDSNGCIDTNTIVVPAYNPPTGLTVSTPAAITCNATTTSVTVAAIAGVAPFTYVITAGPVVNTTGASTGTFSGLTAGTYDFKVTDANGCTAVGSTTINPAPTISVAGSKTNENCVGANDGTATFNITGASTTGNFTYTLSPASGTIVQSGDQVKVTGLGAGTYTLTVKDKTTGCTSNAEQVTINAATAITFNVNGTKINCSTTVSTLTISSLLGGSPGYTYAYAPSPSTTPTTAYGTNLNVDTATLTTNIDVYVKDTNGCFVKKTVTIASEAVPTINPIATQCYTGTPINVTITGTFTGVATYSKDGVNYGSSASFSLTPGTYQLSLKDGFGCPASITYVVADQLTITPTIVPDVTCTPNTTISLSSTGGTGTKTYAVSINGGGYTTTTSPYVATATGTYKFRVTDSATPSCSAVTADIPVTIKATTLTITTSKVDVKCNGDATGSILVTPTSGKAPYTYSITKSTAPFTNYTVNNPSGLTAGTYDIVVTDALGCTSAASTSVTIGENSAVTGVVTAGKLTCNTANTPTSTTISVVAGGGKAGYTYSYNNGSTFISNSSISVSNTGSSQSFTIIVKDANGCLSVPETVTIAPLNSPTDLDFGTPAAITCLATTTNIQLTATNGVAPLNYTIVSGPTVNTSGATTGLFSGLLPGDYLFRVTDNNGCYYSESYKINKVTPIEIAGQAFANAQCFGSKSGIAKYTITKFSATGNYSITVTSTPASLPFTQTVSGDIITLSDLGKGVYNVKVTDLTTGCSADKDVTITEPAAALSAIAKVVNANCKVATAEVTITASNGTPSYKYSFVQDGAGIGTLTPSPVANLNPATNLNWDVYVVDANGCQIKLDVAIAADATPSVTASAAGQCLGSGTYTITATPGTGLVLPLTYSLNGGSYQPGNTFDVTVSGSYIVTIKDGNGCTAPSNAVTVYDKITISSKLDKNITCQVGNEDAKITLTATGGRTAYTYTSNPATGTFVGNVFTTNTPGSYTFTVTDANSCSATTTDAIVITLPVKPSITSVTQTQTIGCSGQSTAAINVVYDATKGVSPFVINVKQYLDLAHTTLVKDFGTQTSGLPAGYYVVTLTDSKQCFDTFNIRITEPDPILISFTPTSLKCNGSGITQGTITINSVSGGTPTYTYYVTGINNYNKSLPGQTGGSAVFEIVDFGLYQIRVEDQNGCSAVIQDVLIAAPPTELGIDVNIVASCAGGSATVKILSAFTGNGPFHFNIYNGSSQTWNILTPAVNLANGWLDENPAGSKSTVFSGLTPGKTYTFIVYDEDTKCYYFQTSTGPVPTNSTLQIDSFVPQNISCTGANDGNVSFDIKSSYATSVDISYDIINAFTNISTGNTGTRTIPAGATVIINPAATTTPLPVGTYYVLVSETSGSNIGCGVSSANFNIKESPKLLSISGSVSKNANCNAKSGVITVVAKDGTAFVPVLPATGPAYYKYMLLLATDPAPTATDLGWGTDNTFFADAGSYIAYALDAYGCIKPFAITLDKDADPAITPPASICYDGNPFTITVAGTVDPAIIGGATYSVNGSEFTTNPAFTFNAAGTYNLVIKDGNGCTDDVDYIVYPQLKLETKVTKELDCSTSPNAVITLTAQGGNIIPTANYIYEYSTTGLAGPWTTMTTNQLTTGATNVTYTFRLTDGNNATTCQVTSDIKLDPIPLPTITPSSTNVTCNTGTDGTISVSVTGGVGPFEYQLMKGATIITAYSGSSQFTGLVAGVDYQVFVKDSNLCEYTTPAIIITEPLLLNAISSVTDYACDLATNVQQSATVIVTVDNTTGTKPYRYLFPGYTDYSDDNTFTVNGTVGGTIAYTVKDSNGCLFNGSQVVLPYQALTAIDFVVVTAPVCPTNVADVRVDITGGYTPMAKYQIIEPVAFAQDNGTSNLFTGLAPNTYLFKVTDDHNCSIQAYYTIDAVVPIEIVAEKTSDISCNILNGTNNNGNAKFTVTDFSASGNYAVNITSSPAGLPYTNSTSGDVITLSDLVAGTYTVEVIDNTTHCIKSASLTFAEPTPITFTALSTKVFCSKDISEITVSSENGGAGGYSYAVVKAGDPAPTTFVNNPVLSVDTNLTDLSWDVYVKDAKGCVSQLVNVPVIYNAAPNLTVPPQQCFVGADIVIDLADPALSTTYNGVKSFTVNGLPTLGSVATFTSDGTYRIVLTDDNGCTSFVDYIIQKQLIATASVTKDLYCAAPINATIDVEISNGVAGYTYETYFNGGLVAGGPNTVTGNTFTASVAAAGDYYFVITDSNTPACSVTTNTVTVDPTVIPTLADSHTDVSCFNGNDGTLTVEATGGRLPYTYTLTGTGANNTGDTTGKYTGLTAGTYTVIATDAKNCPSAVTTITIGQPVLLTATHSIPVNTTCSVATVITVTGHDGTPTGAGVGGYYYNFNNLGYDTNNTFTVNDNTAVQTVTYTVKDGNGCETAPVTVTINPLNKPKDLTFTPTAITCLTGNSSNVTVKATDGVGILTFTITEFNGAAPAVAYPAQTVADNTVSTTFNGLPFGDYKFRVTDSNGCTYDELMTIKDVIRITVTNPLVSDMSCNTTNDGKVTFEVSDFAGTYTYTITKDGAPFVAATTTSANLIPLTNLAFGTYEITATDDITTCPTTYSAVVKQPTVVTVTEVSNVNANCKRGAVVTVAGNGGAPDYTYSFVTAGAPAGAFDAAVTRELDPLTPAWYVYAKDQNGCISAPITVNITTDPLPAGFTANVTSYCADTNGNYEIVVTPGTGMFPFEYSIGGGFQSGTSFTVNVAKAYDLVVRDKFGCESTFPAAINILQPLDLKYNVAALPSCADFDGRVSAEATGGSGNYSYTIDGVTTQTIAPIEFTGLNAGPHEIIVTDVTTTCTAKVNFTLGAATPVTGFDAIATPVTCNGGNNGKIVASIAVPSVGVNDNPVYMYSINGGTPQASPVFEGLIAGDYTVAVISARGCQASKIVKVSEPAIIDVPNPAVVQYGCITENNSNFATITISGVTGGSGTYTNYEFIKNGARVYYGPKNVYTEMDYLGGSYTVNVYDNNGCIGTNAGTYVIAPYISLDKVNVTVTAPITCPTNENISVAVETTGGTPATLNYSIAYSSGAAVPGNPANTNGIFTNLPIGEYIITVVNPATGCTIQKIHNVFDPNTFTIKAETVNGKICFGANDGSVDLTFIDNQLVPQDDAGIFDYVITGPVPSSGTSSNAGPVRISNLTAGEYKVVATLKGIPYCSVETIFSIEQPNAVLAATSSKADITCITGNNDGEISVTATGGWDTTYEYQLVKGTSTVIDYSAQNNFTGLDAGVYTINVRDFNGCTASTTQTLIVPLPIVVTASANVTMLPCFGDKSGVITVDLPTGGQGSNYMYTLNYLSVDPVVNSGPVQSPIFSGLGAGRYSVTVTDGFTCAATSAEIVIDEPTVVLASVVESRAQTCQTLTELTLSAEGGTGPYTYSTDGTTVLGSFTSSISFDVPVGAHKYFVKDANGCTSFVSNTIEIIPLVPLTIKLDVSNAVVKCTGEATGVISADAVGGLGNYVYTLLNGAGTALLPSQDNGRFENLVMGTYRVKVDSGDCSTTSEVITINEPATPLTAQFFPTNVSCFGENNGKLEIVAAGGTGVIKYALSPDLNQFDTKFTFEKLAPGDYQVIVQDENGCFVLHDFTITQPEVLKAKEVPNSMIPEVCVGDKDGAFSVEVTGGTAPYSVSLDNETGTYTQGAAGQTIFDFTNLTGGKHIVYYKDAAGCSNLLEINMPLPVVLDPKAEVNYDCVDNHAANSVTITVDASITNLAEVDYQLDGAGAYQPSNIFTNVAPGIHYVTARHTNGCEVPTASFDIIAVDPLAIALSAGQPEMNVISVTGSGGSPAYEYSFNGEPFSSSNTYKIYKSGDYVVVVRDQNGCTATITVPMVYIDVCLDNYFTPNGDGVYDTWGPGCTNIYNNLEFSIFDRYGRVIAKYHYGQKWDGRYNGAELPSGDYWYVLKLNDEKDNREFVGHFTLYR
ncbi:T9SS type B sorting domain-containing protein [Flavobacterium sp. JLP]|uniref:T9SS type B sorting domain-containing protein n=1 Tax=Flavobacterium sp. JLP TaxID=2783793 RepID=UPI00188A16FB|nr:T9SS type B sorting domain-containing protein [Flavobacterium sp. JLP]MBF4506243.1 T9SS type B sorting domain-containing protein [Flavobacterium sp. JLP]